jgi:hypothetical protein
MIDINKLPSEVVEVIIYRLSKNWSVYKLIKD